MTTGDAQRIVFGGGPGIPARAPLVVGAEHLLGRPVAQQFHAGTTVAQRATTACAHRAIARAQKPAGETRKRAVSVDGFGYVRPLKASRFVQFAGPRAYGRRPLVWTLGRNRLGDSLLMTIGGQTRHYPTLGRIPIPIRDRDHKEAAGQPDDTGTRFRLTLNHRSSRGASCLARKLTLILFG